MIELRLPAAPFEPEEALERFRRSLQDAGGLVSFTGIVRGGGTKSLTLSHYEGYTERRIGELMQDAVRRFGLNGLLIIHRIGRMVPGEPIVLVAAAAPHRREAFKGADMVMDYLKSAAPFWKKEETAEGSRWVEPTARDIEDRERWTG
ncbi:molybdenum cofactor biosynthesis protein MoaE [Parvularcula maris]|uniref:Molybdopterin synthase catalytic subunit n=1 Tax=Parvularcula maris TaxID=2965077 RepID=A0A9X2RHE6_9PROT|nr:molybdenum cofactor biosynthesis protein MoaE [Parvularcula maris]MCQ8184860.1 molybdenum cofactor biosynthesis protein MoaE [Parvularcula maris]